MTEAGEKAGARVRVAARVVLVDGRDRVLLFHGFDPARPAEPYWFTPGGGLDAGETPAQGAARELAEETGLVRTPQELGEPVHREIAHFSYQHVDYAQEQDFFLVRVPQWQVDTSGFDEAETGTIDRHHWWSVSELAATDELFYPRDLVTLLRGWGIGTC